VTEKETPKEEEKKEEKKEDEGKEEVATLDKVKELIDQALEPIKSALGNDDSDDESKEGVEPATKHKDRLGRRPFSMVEADAEKMVQDAVRTVLGEVQHKQEHEELKVTKAPPQKAPIKVRRSTKFWLGKNFGQE
jgi:hypothetical protein